jgi:hypothetical protein
MLDSRFEALAPATDNAVFKPPRTNAMSEAFITTRTYKLYPSPRNLHREIFEHEVFVAHMYALVDPPSYDPQGKWSLFAAHRLADGKNGQLVTYELEADAARFKVRFTPD